MGDDWFNFHVHAGKNEPSKIRVTLIEKIPDLLQSSGYSKIATFDECNRVIVVCPATSAPWITIYDSAAYWTDIKTLIYSPAETDTLMRAISKTIAPVVSFLMSDHWAFWLKLFAGGEQVDKYADNWIPVGWETDEHKAEWVGHSEIWAEHLGLNEETMKKLRQIWDLRDLSEQEEVYYDQNALLEQLLEVLQWQPEYWSEGFTKGLEGNPWLYIKDRAEAVQHGYTELYLKKIQ